MLRGVAGVDLLLDVLADDPEPAAQIVVDIGCEVGDSVVEDLLPQRSLLQRVLGFLLASLEILLEPVATSGEFSAANSVLTLRLRC